MIKEMKMGVYTKGEETYSFNFYTDLSAYEKLMFVNSVVNTLVDETNYDSIIKDLIFDFNIVSIFTDVDISFVNGTDGEDDDINPIILIEEFLEETNVVDIVKANMEVGLFDELQKAVNQSIAYRTGIHTNPLNEALAELINTLEEKISEVNLDDMAEMANIFSGMTDGLTPESLVNAYINSDMYKENLKEIEETKNKSKKSKK